MKIDSSQGAVLAAFWQTAVQRDQFLGQVSLDTAFFDREAVKQLETEGLVQQAGAAIQLTPGGRTETVAQCFSREAVGVGAELQKRVK